MTRDAPPTTREKAMLDLEPVIREAHNACLVLLNFFEHNVPKDKSPPYQAVHLDDVQGKCLHFLITDIEDRVNKVREQFHAGWAAPHEEAATSRDRGDD